MTTSPPPRLDARIRRPRLGPALCLLLACQWLGLATAHAQPPKPSPALSPAPSPAPDSTGCAAAIAQVEPDSRLPTGLLAAIAINESARVDPATRTAAAWPWTVNIAGAGRTFETKAEAIAAVQAAQRGGIRSIDVGCMQVNLYFHPHAFASLDEAFDPRPNVRYAAGFLAALRAQTGGWAAAAAAYHSETPELGLAYAARIAASWPAGARFGLTAQASQAALTALSLEAEVDPNHVLTPEFRARQVEAALFRHQHEAAATSPAAGAVQRIAPGPSRPAPAGRVAPSRAELEAEVDPKGVLTPSFRAELVASAALRHQREADRSRDLQPPVPRLSIASSPPGAGPRS